MRGFLWKENAMNDEYEPTHISDVLIKVMDKLQEELEGDHEE